MVNRMRRRSGIHSGRSVKRDIESSGSSPAGIAVDQATGNVYVSDAGFNRVQVFTADGTFIRAFGQDVVFGAGGENAPAQPAIQSLAVDATAGQYRLSFQGQTTGDVAFDATAGQVQAALEGLSSIGAGNVTVTGAAMPYSVAFTGARGNAPQPLIATANGTTPLSGGAASATVTSTQTGSSGFEVCTAAATCKAGVAGATAGALTAQGFPAVAPAGAPNAGNVLVTDAGNNRVQEYTRGGAFVRAFGWDVTAAGPGNTGTAFEVCNAQAFDICKVGADGFGAGQFASGTPTRIAEDPAGNVYTVEASGTNNGAIPPVATSGFRVQKFTLPSNTVTPQGTFDAAELSGTIGSGLGALLDFPSDIAVDATGNVYVVKRFPLGTGTPPVVIEANGTTIERSQTRLVKVDPTANSGTGAIVETMLANTGQVGGFFIEDVQGLAASPTGPPLYAVTRNGNITRPRVFRVDEITGLTATVSVSDVAATSATLKATVTPAAIPLSTSYHFEYSDNGVDWVKAPETDVNIGNGSGAGDPAGCPVGNPATCEVSRKITDLALDTTYQYRLVASTPYKGTVVTSAAGSFTTHVAPPVAVTGTAVWSGPPASGPSLTFNGDVNPQGVRTTYRFEYVSQADFDATGYQTAASVPAAPVEAGHGSASVEALASAFELDPSTPYHYRLVATNVEGTTIGDDRIVAAPQAGDRFYELVSDGDGYGVGLIPGRLTISDDGNRAMFIAPAFGDQQSSPYITNPNIAQRGPTGWTTTPMGPDPAHSTGLRGAGDSQLTKRLWTGQSVAEQVRGEAQWVFRNLDGSLTPASPKIAPLDFVGPLGTYEMRGGSADLSTFVFEASNDSATAGSTLFPEEPLVRADGPRYSNLYEVAGAGTASPSLSIVNRGVNDAVIGGACGARLGSEGDVNAGRSMTRAVSSDGSVVYFSARAGASAAGSCDTGAGVRIFKRVDSTTVAVSASQCTRTASDPGGACSTVGGDDFYWAASADGSKVFFTSPRQLTNSDTDTTNDLYLYDSSPPAGEPNLVQVSAGQVTTGHPTIGSGAGVLGVSDVSMDGSRVYFAATGQLTPQALAGFNNLYVFERDAAHPNGRIGFIGSLQFGDPDSDLWSKVSGSADKGRPVYALPFYDTDLDGSRVDGDGRFLVFVSVARLLAEDQDFVDDLYRYDDQTGQLACLSCSGDQAIPVAIYGQQINVANADSVQERRIASEDGSAIVFTSREPLAAEDTNVVTDVYLWRDGALTLVSGATGDRGVVGAGGTDFQNGVGGPAISADGNSIFFQTRATLVARDTNNGGYDFYAARVDGGSPLVAPPASCGALSGSCLGPAALPVAGSPSRTVSGGGNADSGERKALSLGALSSSQRRRAARTGRLAVSVRASGAGEVRVVARGRVGKRVRQVARGSVLMDGGGRVTVRLRLDRPARRQLAAGRGMKLTIQVRSAGARARSMTVRLPGVSS